MQSDGDIDNIIIQRNKNGSVTGFELSDGSLEHLQFIKTK